MKYEKVNNLNALIDRLKCGHDQVILDVVLTHKTNDYNYYAIVKETMVKTPNGDDPRTSTQYIKIRRKI